MLWRAFACLEMKKKKEKKGHSHSRPLSSLSAPLPQNSSAAKELISVSCTVHGGVWKVILRSQVGEQTAAREEGGREGKGEGEKESRGYNKRKKRR